MKPRNVTIVSESAPAMKPQRSNISTIAKVLPPMMAGASA